MGSEPEAGGVAFVLGGGGVLGAHEVGMLRALHERGIRPDLVVGTSVGAINGAAFAADPTEPAVRRLADLWHGIERSGVLSGSLLSRVSTLARTRTSLHSPDPLREMLESTLPVERIEECPVRFQCVAASIEGAREHWFTEGPIVDAVLASAAAPGILPPVELDGEHFVDGGIVNSIPVGRAVQLGARQIYVLQVGRVERGLSPPQWPWEVGLVAFEIARRHRFASDMASLPDGVVAHVLPTGGESAPRYNDLSQLRYRNFDDIGERIERSYRASLEFLDAIPEG